MIKKYGGFSMQNQKIKDKIQKTNIKKFGSKSQLKNKEIRD